MTTLDWRTLPAGRELDALVAERVLGHQWYVSESTGRRALFRPAIRPSWFVALAKGDESLARDWDVSVGRFSTNIAEAWIVVAFMREQLFSARRAFTEALRDEVGKSLNLTSKIDHSEVVLNMQPVDICRAALAWAESREKTR